jgi:hypothetical protein
VTPVGPELAAVAVLSGERALFAKQLAAFPALRDRLPEAGATTVRGPAASCSGRRPGWPDGCCLSGTPPDTSMP